jgi:hypothetical protein
MFFLKIYNVDKLKRNDIRSQLLPYHMTGRHDSVSLYLSNDLFQWLENEHYAEICSAKIYLILIYRYQCMGVFHPFYEFLEKLFTHINQDIHILFSLRLILNPLLNAINMKFTIICVKVKMSNS